MNTDSTRNINLNDTNKLIRADLKKAFPGVKFSVRGERASMMTATRIAWTDGPDERTVDEVVANYRAKERDHTGDYWDPRVTTDENGERVYYGSDYITTHRTISEKYMDAAKAKTAELMGVEEVRDNGYTPEDGANLYAIEEFTGVPIHNGYAFGSSLVRWVAGRLAECDFHGVNADEELDKRRRKEALEASTFQAVRAAGGSFEDAHKAVRALTDPKASQVSKELAEEYAQAQQPAKLVDAEEYAAAEEEANCADPERAAFWKAEADADTQWMRERREAIEQTPSAEVVTDTARELLGSILDGFSPDYLAAFSLTDLDPRNPRTPPNH